MAEDFEYSPELISVSDDDGNEYSFEVLDRIETEDGRYVAVIEYFEDPSKMLEDDGEVIILKVQEEDGESYLLQIEDDAEFEEVYDIFNERLSELYEDDDEDEE